MYTNVMSYITAVHNSIDKLIVLQDGGVRTFIVYVNISRVLVINASHGGVFKGKRTVDVPWFWLRNT